MPLPLEPPRGRAAAPRKSLQSAVDVRSFAGAAQQLEESTEAQRSGESLETAEPLPLLGSNWEGEVVSKNSLVVMFYESMGLEYF